MWKYVVSVEDHSEYLNLDTTFKWCSRSNLFRRGIQVNSGQWEPLKLRLYERREVYGRQPITAASYVHVIISQRQRVCVLYLMTSSTTTSPLAKHLVLSRPVQYRHQDTYVSHFKSLSHVFQKWGSCKRCKIKIDFHPEISRRTSKILLVYLMLDVRNSKPILLCHHYPPWVSRIYILILTTFSLEIMMTQQDGFVVWWMFALKTIQIH